MGVEGEGTQPTEAEWEYAARAGSSGPRDGDVNAIGWWVGNSNKHTHDVGLKQPNPWGLQDMLGNVWQWTADWYDEKYYAHSPAKDPKGPSQPKQYRVVRGGSWFYLPGTLRSSTKFAVCSGTAMVVWITAALVIARPASAQAPWPMFQHDPQHTGLSPVDTSGNPGQEKWRINIGGNPISTSPAIAADGTIYAANTIGQLYAFNPDGTLKWTTPSLAQLGSTPAIGPDGTIYVGGDPYFYAINPDGTVKWKYPTQGQTLRP